MFGLRGGEALKVTGGRTRDSLVWERTVVFVAVIRLTLVALMGGEKKHSSDKLAGGAVYVSVDGILVEDAVDGAERV